MKSKNFNKKLVLNKRTVLNLNQSAMKGLKGGFTANTCYGITCPICDSNISCYLDYRCPREPF